MAGEQAPNFNFVEEAYNVNGPVNDANLSHLNQLHDPQVRFAGNLEASAVTNESQFRNLQNIQMQTSVDDIMSGIANLDVNG